MFPLSIATHKSIFQEAANDALREENIKLSCHKGPWLNGVGSFLPTSLNGPLPVLCLPFPEAFSPSSSALNGFRSKPSVKFRDIYQPQLIP